MSGYAEANSARLPRTARAPEAVRRRLRSFPAPRGLLFIAVLFLLLGSVYALTTPPFEAPDEVWHVAYARFVAIDGGLPVQGGQRGEHLLQQEASQPPLYYLIAAPLLRRIDTSDFERVATINPHAAAGQPHSDGNKNMIVPSPGRVRWQGSLLAVQLMRALSLLCGLVTVVCAFALARRAFPHAQALPLAAAALVAFNPQFLFLSASANNDNLITALASLALLAMASMAPFSAPTRQASAEPSLRPVVVLGILCGLAAITKLTGGLLTSLAALVIVAEAWASGGTWRQRIRQAARGLAVFGVLVAAIAGWWYVRNWQLYADVTGLRPMLDWVGQRSLTLRQALAELQGVELSYWAVFGWFNVVADEVVYTVLRLTARLAIAGLLVAAAQAAWRRLRQTGGGHVEVHAPVLLLCAMWAMLVFAGLLRWTATTHGSQGRLLFPAISAISALIVAGVSTLIPRRLRAPALGLGLGALAVLAALAPWRYIAPAYARPPVVAAEDAAIARPVSLTYGDQEIELLGYALDRERVAPAGTLAVTLYYQALRPLATDYSLFIHLWGRDMEWLGQRDSHPGRGSLPASAMTPGQIISDRYLVTVPATATVPARVQIEVGIYDFASGSRLAAIDSLGQRVDLPMIGRLKLADREPAPPAALPYQYQFGAQMALIDWSIAPAPTPAPAAVITVTTRWLGLQRVSEDYTIFMHLLDSERSVVAQADGQPQAGQYPTGLWDEGEVVSDRRTLRVPASLPSGRYTIVAGWYLLRTGERLPVRGPAGAIANDWAILGEITLP